MDCAAISIFDCPSRSSIINHPSHDHFFKIERQAIGASSMMKILLVLLLSSATAFQPSQQQQPQQQRSRSWQHHHRADTSTTTVLSMVARNANFAKLAGGYLFPEIGRRRSAYAAANPQLADRIISLGIGDTTLPIPPHILSGLKNGAAKLGTKEGYSGYGDVQGRTDLRQKIADTLYKGIIEPDEVFVTGTFVFSRCRNKCARCPMILLS
jgi:hypothetical protein